MQRLFSQILRVYVEISIIIQAEKFLNADWLKRAIFILNTCRIWKRVVFQGVEILLSSKYGKCQQDKQDGGHVNI